MGIYKATVIDKRAGAESSYESYVAVGDVKGTSFTDEDIHYYFTKDEFKPVNGEIETEEFKYLIGKRVA